MCTESELGRLFLSVMELNDFLSSHRILRVHDEIVLKRNDPYLIFIVEYLDGPSAEKLPKAPKEDYRAT